jgi:glycosyltransferase involved in cell wall biosynthesis
LKFQWHLRDIWNKKAKIRFAEILESERPDIVHTNNLTGFSVAIWSEARRKSVPIVHTLRDYSLLCRRATLFRNGQNCDKRCLDCTLMTAPSKCETRHIDRVVSNSRFVLDMHVSKGYFSNTPSDVIFNIMDTVEPGISQPTRPDGAVAFGYIGKIEQNKGIEIVLEATAKIKRTDWRLMIAGQGNQKYMTRLRERFSDSRIKWLGFTAISDVMSQIDVTIISSIWQEPLPRVLIESIAYRRPTICSTAGGTPEIARYADLIGEYDPENVDALAQLMDQAISEGRFAETFKQNTAADLPDLFGGPAIASRNIAVYEAAMSEHSRQK